MKKGINVWSMPDDLTLEETFAHAKKAGFDTIEFNLSEPSTSGDNFVNADLGLNDTDFLPFGQNEEQIAAIAKFSDQYDLPISSISTNLHWTYPLTSSDPEKREKGKVIVRAMIDACVALGGDTVLVVPGLVTKEQAYDTCYDLALEAFTELAPYAEEHQITIGIENVWNKFLLSPLETANFIDLIDSDYVGMYFDAGNVLQFGYPEQWVSILGDRIAKIHIKDFNTTIGNITGFTTLLAGDMDWSALISSLREIGYNGPLTCELTPYHENGIQLAYDTSNAMDYILGL